MQRRAIDRQASADTVPKPGNVDVGQATTTVVEKALPPYRIRSGCHGRSDAELTHAPHAVAGQVQTGAGRVPLGRPLYDLGCDVTLTNGAGERETGDTGPDDQHTHRDHAFGSMFWFPRKRFSGS